MANLVVHFEISATDPQTLIDFYSKLLGWQFTNYGGEQPYWIIDTGEGSVSNAAGRPGMGINGGMVPRRGPRPEVGAPVMGACLVLGVDDVDGLMAKGVELGGKVAMPAQDWPGVGRGGYLLDPDNNIFGLISPVMSDGTVAMGSGAEG
jgi:predicted enzyme related to lactoylglutathione lyase